MWLPLRQLSWRIIAVIWYTKEGHWSRYWLTVAMSPSTVRLPSITTICRTILATTVSSAMPPARWSRWTTIILSAAYLDKVPTATPNDTRICPPIKRAFYYSIGGIGFLPSQLPIFYHNKFINRQRWEDYFFYFYSCYIIFILLHIHLMRF